MSEITSVLKNFFKKIWNGIDAARRISVNLLFLVLVAALLFILFHDDSPTVADSTALVIAPKGRLVEQLTAKSLEQIINEAQGAAPAETLLKDVIDAIAAGKNDDRVKALVLNLSEFDGAMMTKLHDVRDVIIDFKSRSGGCAKLGVISAQLRKELRANTPVHSVAFKPNVNQGTKSAVTDFSQVKQSI